MSNTKIEFITLTMRNFLSYGNNTTIVQFNIPGSTMIQGEDLDVTADGKAVNGTGKTTLINAIAYCLYDKPVSNISKDNLVNNINKKHMLVTLDFKKGEEEFRIERARKMKSGAYGNYVNFLKKGEDGEYINIARNNKNTNVLIEKTIGTSYDLFCQIVIFSATKTPFLDLPVRHPQQTNQTAMIETLFGLTELSEKAEIIKKHTKELVPDLEKLGVRMGQIEREHGRHKEQIMTAEKRILKWEQDNLTQIDKLKHDLKLVDEVDVDAERVLHDSLKDAEKEIKVFGSTLKDLDRSFKSHLKTKKSKTKELEHLQDDKCPYCLQDFKDAQDKMKTLNLECSELDDEILSFGEAIEETDTNLEVVTNAALEIKEKMTISNLEELINIKAQTTQIHDKIKELGNADNPFVEPLNELEAMELDPVDYTEINALKIKIEHERFLVKLLTKRDSFVRKVLLNKNLPFLNRRLAKYLNELGLPHCVEFNGELVAEITRFGRLLDFGNLSNGQRARVNIALSFAFRDVLQKLHNSINVCLLDEILDVGLDSVGVQGAAKMIKRMAREEGSCVYIISHKEELESVFDRTMCIQMSKGFSYIKEPEL